MSSDALPDAGRPAPLLEMRGISKSFPGVRALDDVSLDVEDGETMTVAFVADNPGIWMDHCHNLKHAAQGLVAHLMYSNVTEPYLLGKNSGNEPE